MLYATGSAGLATLARGSSRRIKIMRFRPANIRLINRRANLPRLRLALSPENGKNNDNYKNNPTEARELTGALHISAVPAQSKSHVEKMCTRAIYLAGPGPTPLHQHHWVHPECRPITGGIGTVPRH